MQFDAITEIEKIRIVLQCLRAFSDGTTKIVGGYTPTANKKYPMPDCKARITVSTVSLENAARLVYQALEVWNAATDPESKHGADKLWFVHRSHWGTAVMAGSGQQIAEVNAPLAVRQKLLWWDELVTKANARDVVRATLPQVLRKALAQQRCAKCLWWAGKELRSCLNKKNLGLFAFGTSEDFGCPQFLRRKN